MPTVDESIVINRPRNEVYDFAQAAENQTLFQSNMVAFDRPEGPMEAGMKMEGATRVAGKKVEWTSEAIEVVPNEKVVMRSIEAPMDFEIIWRYEDAGEGRTKVIFHQEVPAIGGFFGKLGDAVVTKMYSHDVKSNLAKMKELLEA